MEIIALRDIEELQLKAKQQWPAANHEGQLFLKGYQMALEELKARILEEMTVPQRSGKRPDGAS